MIWLGGPLPEDLQRLVDTFTRTSPDWTIRWWHEREINQLRLRNRQVYDRAGQLVSKDSKYQLQSDIARYEILYRHGGMYIDCDYWWQKPIGPWLEGESLVTCWEVDSMFVANGFIAAAPGHPAMLEAIEQVPYRVGLRKPWWRANRLTGPHLWTPVAMRHATILPSKVMHPLPHTDAHLASRRRFPNATAIHIWNHQAQIRGLK